MQAYATSERLTLRERCPSTEPAPATTWRRQSTQSVPDDVLIDQLLGRLADLVVDRLMERADESAKQPVDDWMDARAAAA